MRKNDKPFKLTKLESRVLELKRSGMTNLQIKEVIGSKTSVAATVRVAVEKERQIVLDRLDKGSGERTSLARARSVRRDGSIKDVDPIKGI